MSLRESRQLHAFPAENLVLQLTHTCRRQAGWGAFTFHSWGTNTPQDAGSVITLCCHIQEENPVWPGEQVSGEKEQVIPNGNTSWDHPTQTAWVEGCPGRLASRRGSSLGSLCTERHLGKGVGAQSPDPRVSQRCSLQRLLLLSVSVSNVKWKP